MKSTYMCTQQKETKRETIFKRTKIEEFVNFALFFL